MANIKSSAKIGRKKYNISMRIMTVPRRNSSSVTGTKVVVVVVVYNEVVVVVVDVVDVVDVVVVKILSLVFGSSRKI